MARRLAIDAGHGVVSEFVCKNTDRNANHLHFYIKKKKSVLCGIFFFLLLSFLSFFDFYLHDKFICVTSVENWPIGYRVISYMSYAYMFAECGEYTAICCCPAL